MSLAASTDSLQRSRALGIETAPVMLLLAPQLALYIWMAPRGIDFTDEAFYLLNYLHWRDLAGVVSFFGFYLELPFRVAGQSVAAMRCLTLLLLVTSAGWFAHQTLRYAARRRGEEVPATGPFVVAASAASLFYFSYLSTLRAPSYNLLVLCSMLVSTGLLLRSLDAPALSGRRWTVFLYGVMLGVCGLSKATSGLLLAICHAAFFVVVNPAWRLRPVLERVALTVLGVALNVAVLSLVHPAWIQSLLAGVAIFAYTGQSQLLDMVNGFRWDIQRIGALWPWIGGLALATGLWFWRLGRARGALASVGVTTLVAGAVVVLIVGPTGLWWPALVVLAGLLIVAEFATRTAWRPTRDDAAELALLVLLLLLPLAFSFGTALPVLEHSIAAAAFAVVAVSGRLVRLARSGLIGQPAMALCLSLMCAPTLWIQLQAARDVRYSYRQASALAEQNIPVQFGYASARLLVDETTRQTLDGLTAAARGAGWQPGQAVLDFTGEGPGLVFALQARPLGVAWLVGGYPNSRLWAERLLEKLTDAELKQAWLFSSPDNPRAIPGWQALVQRRLGAASHELVATVRVRAPSHWGGRASDTADLQLWRPAGR